VAINKKHQKTLSMIFKTPVPSNVRWDDIEKLLINLQAIIDEGRGSRIRIELNGVKAVFHHPHPNKETDKGVLVLMRRFLMNAGIYYDEV
jgi:HicA toxin of bacterial toxin-antitoxin,